MDIIIRDVDVLKIIIEFLQSRDLLISSEALIKEAEITDERDENLNLQTLQKFSWSGKWNEVNRYLQPFYLYLGENKKKRLNQLLFRQCFCENQFSNQFPDLSNFKSIRENVQNDLDEISFQQFIHQNHEYYEEKRKEWQITEAVKVATRLECYNEILELTKKGFLLNKEMLSTQQDDKLVSMLIKGSLYDVCSGYCSKRARQNLKYEKVKMETLPEDVKEYNLKKVIERSKLQDVSSHFFYWLRGIKEKEVFKQPFIAEDVQIVVEKMKKREERFLLESDNAEMTFKSNEKVEDEKRSDDVTAVDDEVVQDDDDVTVVDREVVTPVNEDIKPINHDIKPVNHDIKPVNHDIKPVNHDIKPVYDDVTPINNTVKSDQNTVTSSSTTRDSFSDFLLHQQNAKSNRDRILSELQLKEKEAKKVRNILEKSPESARCNIIKSSRRHPFNYIPVEKTKDEAVIRSVSFHPGGSLYAVGSNSQRLKICRIPANHLASMHKLNARLKDKVGVMWSQPVIELSKVHKGSLYAVEWNDSGDLLATCSNDKTIKLFRFNEQEVTITERPRVLAHHHGPVRDITFISSETPSSACIASAGSNDGIIYITDCSSSSPIHKLQFHQDQVLSLFSSGSLLASASKDRTVCIWDLRSARCIDVIRFPSVPTSACFDPRRHHLAVGCTDSSTSVYDFANLTHKPLQTFNLHDNEVRSVRYHPLKPDVLLSASYDHTSIVVDYHHEEITSSKLRHHHDKVIQSRWHPNGMMLASTSADQTCVLAVVQEKLLEDQI